MRKLISILLCLAMILGSAASVFADTSQGTATTLRLEKTEGKVAITKAGGKSVTVKEGTRLYDGYEIKTDKKSAAYVSLDSAKAVMLDASTDVTIKKSGKKLEIMLKAGTVLLNVEDKLSGNEELNIRTTNSVTGIRGTIVQASFNPKTQNSEIYLFEGMTTGKYLAPDGSWYTQTLTTGSWLASGMGMLAENPEYNGWTVGPNGEWIYTNNKIEGTQFRQWRWSADQGWFTFDINTGAVTKQEAWPFTFKDLQPRVQKEILGTPSMLTRGQEHLDLYPELAEKEITATRETAGIVLTQQEEEIEKQDAAIQAAYEEGNGGNTVNNLFKEEAPSVPTYPMVFMMDDPETVANAARYTTQYYQEGEAVTAPAAPTREGYTFAGWNSPLPTAKAATEEMVYATWTINQYTLSFVDSDGITELADSITADYGTPVTAPANPTKTGYTFAGWDATVPATMPGKDMTFKAKWGIDQHTITFNTNGGSTIAPITQDYGTSVTAPADPTRTGYTFAGWDAAIPTTMPATDMTITAAWTINQYTLTFLNNDGTVLSALTQDYGTAVTAPTAADTTGCTFTGWNPAAPATMPASDMTLVPVQTPNPYTITFKDDDGTVFATITQDYGTAITAPADPTRTGYKFTGWDTTIPTTMPAEDLTITATWTNQFSVVVENNTGANITAYAGGDAINPADRKYTVSYGTEIIFSLTWPDLPSAPQCRITDNADQYHPLDESNTFSVKVMSEDDITITIEDISEAIAAGTVTIKQINVYVYEENNGGATDITFNGKILAYTVSDGDYTLDVEGTEGVTLSVEGKLLDGYQYGIQNVKYYDDTEVIAINYDVYTGTYNITDNVNINIKQVYTGISFTGDTDIITIESYTMNYGGNSYTFATDSRLTFTTDDTKIVIDPNSLENSVEIKKTVDGDRSDAEFTVDRTDIPGEYRFIIYDVEDNAEYNIKFTEKL